MSSPTINPDDGITIEVVDTSTSNGGVYNPNTIMKYVNTQSVSKHHKWSRSSEKTINKYIQKSLGYKSLYYETYFMYSFWHRIIFFVMVLANGFSLLFQAISSTLVVTSDSTDKNISDSQKNRNTILTIISAVSTALVTATVALYTQTRYDIYATGCRDAALAFSDFADDLKTLLTIPREIRADPYQIIHTIQIDYKKILKNYAKFEIPHNIFKKFTNAYTNKGIILDIVDNTTADQFDLHDGTLEQNIITNKFIDSLKDIQSESTRLINPNDSLNVSGSQTGRSSATYRENLRKNAINEILNEKSTDIILDI